MAPAKVEVIAGLTGCTAEIRVEAEELCEGLREGLCRTKQGEYRITTFPITTFPITTFPITTFPITTFPEGRFKVAWLDSAAMYGGKYLLGTRWVVSATPELLEGFRSRLGGTVRELRSIAPATGS